MTTGPVTKAAVAVAGALDADTVASCTAGVGAETLRLAFEGSTSSASTSPRAKMPAAQANAVV